MANSDKCGKSDFIAKMAQGAVFGSKGWCRIAKDVCIVLFVFAAIFQNNLGNCCNKGDGVAKDKSEAVKWFRKAAANGIDDAKKALEALGYKLQD